MIAFFPFNLSQYSLRLSSSLSCADLTFRDFVFQISNISLMRHFDLIQVSGDLRLFPLIINSCLCFSRFDIINFLLNFPFKLLNSLFPLWNLSSFFINFLLFVSYIFFFLLKLSFISCADLSDERIDVTTRLTNLLSQLINMHPLLELLPQIVLLVFKEVTLVLQVFGILHFSIFDINLVDLSEILFIILYRFIIISI